MARALVGEESPCSFIPLLNVEVVLVGEADVRAAADRVLAELLEAGRSEGTVRRHQVVLDRFVAFLAGRGLDDASDRVCLDFIAGQTGIGLGRCGSRSGTRVFRRSAGRWC